MWNLRSYPSTVLNKRMWNFLFGGQDPQPTGFKPLVSESLLLQFDSSALLPFDDLTSRGLLYRSRTAVESKSKRSCNRRVKTWMRALPQSATRMFPASSTATPVGRLNWPFPSPKEPKLKLSCPSSAPNTCRKYTMWWNIRALRIQTNVIVTYWVISQLITRIVALASHKLPQR